MRATLALIAALAAGTAAAQQPPPEPTGELALELKVGERKSVCPCPVSGLVCDDPSLVKVVEGTSDVFLEGVKPGSTLCSLTGPNFVRRTYRVKVVEPLPRGRRR